MCVVLFLKWVVVVECEMFLLPALQFACSCVFMFFIPFQITVFLSWNGGWTAATPITCHSVVSELKKIVRSRNSWVCHRIRLSTWQSLTVTLWQQPIKFHSAAWQVEMDGWVTAKQRSQALVLLDIFFTLSVHATSWLLVSYNLFENGPRSNKYCGEEFPSKLHF